MAEANQSIFSNRHIMVTQDATDLEVIQNGDNAKVFGFDIKPLHDACLQVDFSFLNNNNKTKRKKPLDEITSNSQQNKQFNKDDFDKINSNILVEDVEVGNGVFCSISTLLKVLIPFWKSGEKPVITVGDTLRKKNPSLFTSIELLNYVPDELRILLQITD
ncbi:21806_t:CDS:2, partial [Entrophospora sp. SA101]